jgi:hypothetical protein
MLFNEKSDVVLNGHTIAPQGSKLSHHNDQIYEFTHMSDPFAINATPFLHIGVFSLQFSAKAKFFIRIF